MSVLLYGFFISLFQWWDGVGGSARVPALFVFGDSLVDVGNNNFLNSIAKSNYFPYGIDFNMQPTGRFCNGKTFVDIIGEFLGVPYPPPFADPNTVGARLLGGVNYASAAAGILDESGQNYGERYSLNQQVLNFQSTLDQIRTMTGSNFTSFLSRSIAILVFGNNDYINNYLMPSMYSSSRNYNPSQFANLLVNQYGRQLWALYSLGLRKVFIAGIGPIGCIPNLRGAGQAAAGRCVDNVNQILGSFNQGLKSIVDEINTHPGAAFAYGNTYTAVGDILNNPSSYGFNVVDRGCCGMDGSRGPTTCLPFAYPCTNRDQFVFWDGFHPTEAVNNILSRRAFNGPPQDSYPINIQQMSLIGLDTGLGPSPLYS